MIFDHTDNAGYVLGTSATSFEPDVILCDEPTHSAALHKLRSIVRIGGVTKTQMRKVNRGRSLGAIRSTVNRAIAISFATRLPMVELDFKLLNIDTDKCIYCLGSKTCWDHFDNITTDGKWSQQLEALVPACDRCNEEGKGNRAPEIYAAELDGKGHGKDGLLRTATDRVAIVRQALPRATDLGGQVAIKIQDFYDRYNALWTELTKLDADVKGWVQEELLPAFESKLAIAEPLDPQGT